MARFFLYQECKNIIVFYLNVRHHCYQVFGITFFCNDYSRLVILKGSIDCLHRRGHCLLFFHNDDGTSVVVSRSANAYAHNMYLLGPLLSFPSIFFPYRQSFLSSLSWMWSVRSWERWSLQPPWCCSRNLRGLTNSSRGWHSLSATCRRWGKWFNHVTKVLVKENGHERGGLGVRQTLEFILLCTWENFSCVLLLYSLIGIHSS